jgi:hypothetical protein
VATGGERRAPQKFPSPAALEDRRGRNHVRQGQGERAAGANRAPSLPSLQTIIPETPELCNGLGKSSAVKSHLRNVLRSKCLANGLNCGELMRVAIWITRVSSLHSSPHDSRI